MRVNNEQQNLSTSDDAWNASVPAGNPSSLYDFLLNAETEDDIKAGCPSCSWGPPVLNHNETAGSDEEDDVQLADLPIVDQQADEVGGGTEVLPVVNHDPGYKWNHNETAVSDEEDEVQLADLPIVDEQADEVGGGTEVLPVVNHDPGFKWNHNETTLSDTLN